MWKPWELQDWGNPTGKSQNIIEKVLRGAHCGCCQKGEEQLLRKKWDCPGPSLLFFKWRRAFDLWKNGNAHCCFYCTGNNVKQLRRESREVKNSLISQLHGGGKVAQNPRGPDPQDLGIPTCLSQRWLFRTETQTPHDPSLISFCHCSVAQLYPTLCDPKDCISPGFTVHHHLPEFAQTHFHWVSDAIQPFHPLLPPSPPALNFSQHQGLFQ